MKGPRREYLNGVVGTVVGEAEANGHLMHLPIDLKLGIGVEIACRRCGGGITVKSEAGPPADEANVVSVVGCNMSTCPAALHKEAVNEVLVRDPEAP